MPLRRREFGGEMWEWGDVPGTTLPGWNPWRGRGYGRPARPGRATRPASGEWIRHGHGPGAAGGYGWDYRGGAPRGEHLTWPEDVGGRGMGGGRIREEMRSGGLPRRRYAADYRPRRRAEHGYRYGDEFTRRRGVGRGRRYDVEYAGRPGTAAGRHIRRGRPTGRRRAYREDYTLRPGRRSYGAPRGMARMPQGTRRRA